MPVKKTVSKADLEKDFFQVLDEDDTTVDYHYYDNCADCGVRLYACSSADGNADEKLADNVAVPAGKRSFCAACYPNNTVQHGEDVYILVGQCQRCNEDVFGWVDGPGNHGAIGNQLSAHVRQGGYLCQQHYHEFLLSSDPQAYSEVIGGARGKQDGDVIDKWERNTVGRTPPA